MSEPITAEEGYAREELRSRFQAGVDLMNRINPSWRRTIDVDSLVMSDGNKCLFGQVYGGFDNGLEQVFTESDSPIADAARHGFYVDSGEEEVEARYSYLDKLWKKAVKGDLDLT